MWGRRPKSARSQQRACGVLLKGPWPRTRGNGGSKHAPFAVLRGERYLVSYVHAMPRRSCTCSARRHLRANLKARRQSGNNPLSHWARWDRTTQAGRYQKSCPWPGWIHRQTRSVGLHRKTSTWRARRDLNGYQMVEMSVSQSVQYMCSRLPRALWSRVGCLLW